MHYRFYNRENKKFILLAVDEREHKRESPSKLRQKSCLWLLNNSVGSDDPDYLKYYSTFTVWLALCDAK